MEEWQEMLEKVTEEKEKYLDLFDIYIKKFISRIRLNSLGVVDWNNHTLLQSV